MAKRTKARDRKGTPAWGGYVRLNLTDEERATIEQGYAGIVTEPAQLIGLIEDLAGQGIKVAFTQGEDANFCVTLNIVRQSTNTLHVISSFAPDASLALFVSWYKWEVIIGRDADEIDDAEVIDAIWR